jgi:DNA polymerase-3 subunit delta
MENESLENKNQKSLASLYLFYGDEFLVKERVEKLISEVLDAKLRGTNLTVLDGNNLDFSILSSNLFTPSLFGGYRVVIVDQTPLFMGRLDQARLVGKVLQSWKSNDRKGAFRGFGQLLNLAGLQRSDIEGRTDWLAEITGESATGDDRETLLKVARSFLDAGQKVESSDHESFIEELLESPLPEETILIFTAPAVDKRKRIFKTLLKRGQVVECSVREEKSGAGLERSFFDKRVKETLALAGKKISTAALDKMHARTGKDMRRLHGEMEKLIAYVGPRKEVRPQDVDAVFMDFHEAAFYEFNESLRKADVGECLRALHQNLKIVEHPLQTLGAVANEIRRLMAARELLFGPFRTYWKPGMTYQAFLPVLKRVREQNPGSTAKGKLDLLSMNDYRLYLYLSHAQRFSMERLILIMEAILEADVLIKSTRVGSASPRSIMENLVLKICGVSDSPKATGKTNTN